MNKKENIHQEQYTIRSYEVHPDGSARIQSICNLLQETAGNHALELNFDISQLKDRDLTWVLYRLQVEISRFPEWRDKIIIETWPSRGDQLRAYRDFRLLDMNGDELTHALSYWMMIDMNTRRPVRMPEEVLRMGDNTKPHTMPVSRNRLKGPKETPIEKVFSVRRSDLDVNNHVNNVKYIEWALEAVPDIIYDHYRTTGLDIQFQAEGHYGEDVISGCLKSEEDGNKERPVYQHVLKQESDQKTLAIARSTWNQY